MMEQAIGREMFVSTYANVYEGDPAWRALETPSGSLYAWDEASTYIRRPPFFDGMSLEPGTIADIAGARCLVAVGDSVTTDHIPRPARSSPTPQPAGIWSSTTSNARTSTPTAPAAATTR